MTRRLRALVVLRMDLSQEHGTTLWAKNYLRSLARMSNVDFTVVLTGPESSQEVSHQIAETLGLLHIFLPYRNQSPPRRDGALDAFSGKMKPILDVLLEKYYFWGELDCRKQAHIEPALLNVIKDKQPDLIIVSHMSAAVQAPSIFDLSIPCCLICLNNEIPLYKELKAQGGLSSMGKVHLWLFRHFNWIANMRARRFIESIHRKSAGIVTLNNNDLPTNLPPHIVRAVIPPVLERSSLPWRYGATRRLLFVGNLFYGAAIHFPNWSAIEWICTKLAPETAQIDKGVRIVVIGAETTQVPLTWRSANINFLGRSDSQTLAHQITTADLFVAPIANSHGSKFKLAECVSHGTPFVATEGAMSGLPFLPWIPRIQLDEPSTAARTVLEYMNDPHKLANLSESILAAAEQARTAQDAAWSTFLTRTAESKYGFRRSDR